MQISTNDRSRILIVDDNSDNIDILNEILKNDYNIQVALSGAKALQIAASDQKPDLILLDIMMPEMDGYTVCKKLKKNHYTQSIPVIFLTAKSDITDEMEGFRVGGVDYIRKPVSPPVVQARIRTHLALHNQNKILEKKVRERTIELSHTQDVTILSMATLAEYRDNETGGHIMRTKHYIEVLAKKLLHDNKYKEHLNEEIIDLLVKSAPLHDIGKVGIPDNILLKPGRLTTEEFEIMKKHTLYGQEAIIRAEEALRKDMTTSFLRFAREIAYTHHEKWDGSGYPQGLKGEAIPISGRLMAVVDVYDALISKRVYKPPIPHTKALAIMMEQQGKHFDPYILDDFMSITEDFKAIALRYVDYDEEKEALTK